MTLSKDTILNDVAVYIRNVLRNHLVDRRVPSRSNSLWIFKDLDEDAYLNAQAKEQYPKVFVTANGNSSKINLSNSTYKLNAIKISLDTEVWVTGANAIYNRDKLSDDIISIFKNPLSTDGTNTIKSQNLVFKSWSSDNDDRVIGENIFRIKRITSEWVYIGN